MALHVTISFSMLTILGHTLLFPYEPLTSSPLMTSSLPMTSFLHHYDLIPPHFTPL